MLVMQLFKCDTLPHTAPKRQRKECLDDDEDDDDDEDYIPYSKNKKCELGHATENGSIN